MIDSKTDTNLEISENQGYLDFLTKFEDPLKFPTQNDGLLILWEIYCHKISKIPTL